MATYYVDLTSGNDAAAGTIGAPLKKISVAIAKAGAPHVVRVAKNANYATVTANCTFTNHSKTINTATDISASFPAGSYIGKATSPSGAVASGNGATETFYRVASSNASSITLEQFYYGTTEIATAVYNAPSVALGEDLLTLSIGTTVIGGWDMVADVRNGETWVKPTTAGRGSTEIITVGTSCSLQYLNCTEFYRAVVSNNAGGSVVNNVCSLGNAAMGLYLQGGNGNTFTDCIFHSLAVNGGVYSAAGTYALPNVLTRCTINAANQAFTSGAVAATVHFYYCIICDSTVAGEMNDGFYFNNCTFSYLSAGVKPFSAASNIVFDTCTFQNCTIGIANNISAYNTVQVLNCTFTSCIRGIYANYSRRTYVRDCTFTSCTYGIDLLEYCADWTLVNCTFTTPVTLGIQRVASVGVINCYGCTIDAPSVAKAYNTVAWEGYQIPNYVLQNSFNQTGLIYGNGSVIADYTNERSPGTEPCLAITLNNSVPPKFNDVIVARAYVNSGTAKTFSIYVKCQASAVGSYVPKFRLNGQMIHAFAAVTTFPTDWTLYTYTASAGEINAEGSLDLVFENVYTNNKTIWVDSVVVA
jgi:parallel beta-helix repeat protein